MVVEKKKRTCFFNGATQYNSHAEPKYISLGHLALNGPENLGLVLERPKIRYPSGTTTHLKISAPDALQMGPKPPKIPAERNIPPILVSKNSADWNLPCP